MDNSTAKAIMKHQDFLVLRVLKGHFRGTFDALTRRLEVVKEVEIDPFVMEQFKKFGEEILREREILIDLLLENQQPHSGSPMELDMYIRRKSKEINNDN